MGFATVLIRRIQNTSLLRTRSCLLQEERLFLYCASVCVFYVIIKSCLYILVLSITFEKRAGCKNSSINILAFKILLLVVRVRFELLIIVEGVIPDGAWIFAYN